VTTRASRARCAGAPEHEVRAGTSEDKYGGENQSAGVVRCLRFSSPVKPVRRAVIDVGTNSVKLLVAEVSAW